MRETLTRVPSRRNLLTQKRESFILSHPLASRVGSIQLEPTARLARRVLGRAEKSSMRNAHKQLTVDVIGSAPKPWSAYLEQSCLAGITPFLVMEETARTGP
jgi:hypothetical protein